MQPVQKYFGVSLVTLGSVFRLFYARRWSFELLGIQEIVNNHPWGLFSPDFGPFFIHTSSVSLVSHKHWQQKQVFYDHECFEP